MSKSCWQTIAWGRNDDPIIKTYQFMHFHDRDAFLWGVQEAAGWLHYKKLEHGEGVHEEAKKKHLG